MAGDGVNDASALSQADIGIAMRTGTDVAIESAAITLVKGDLNGIAKARLLSHKVMGNIKGNLFFALVYNFYLRLANSMQDYYKIHADELQYFKKEVRKAFATICSSFGLREEKVILTDIDNLFQVTFSSSRTRIVVKGMKVLH